MASTSNFDLTYNQQNVVAGGALSNPAATTGVTGGGVDQIIAGSNITISPSGGTGAVTINSTAGGTGTVTSVATGTGLTGGPITTSGTISLASAYAGNGIGTVNGIAKGNGSGTITAASAGTDYVIPSGSITGTAGNITATSNSTLTTLSALSLPGSQVSGNISGNAANITATSNSTLTTLSALSLPGSQVSGNISGNSANVTGTVAIGNGGTGATTASAARTNLGLGSVATQTAPSGTSSQLLANNGTGGFNNVTVGSGLTYSGGTLSSSAGGGTVTSVGTSGSVNGITLSGGPITTSGTITLGGTLGSIANSQLSNSSVTVTAGTGLSGGGSVSLGGSTTLTNAGVTSLTAGTGISLSGSTGGVTITNTVSGLPSGTQGQALLYGSSGGAFLNTAINVLTYGSSYSAISSAASAAQSAGTSLYFPQGSYTISSNLTITCPIIIDGVITINSGVTLTLNGTVWAALKQVFTVNGSLKIGSNTPYIYPEWFGTPKNGSSDDSAGINAALNAATTISITSSVPAVQYIVLTGNYTLNSTITITGGKMFKVIGGAQFTAGTATDAIIYDGTGTNNGSSVQGDIPTCVNFSGTALYLKGTKVMNLKFFGTLGCGVGVKVGAVSGSDSLDNKVECMFFENTTVGFFITTDGSTNPSGATVALQGNELYCNFYTLDSQPSSTASAVYWDNVNLTNCDGNSVRVKAIEFNGKTNVYGFHNASSYAVNGWEVVSDDWFGGITSSNVSSAKFASGYFQACTFKFLMRGSLGSLSWSNMGVYGEYNRMEFRNGGAGSSSYIGQPVLQTSANSRSSFNSYPIFQNRVVCSYTFAFDFGVGSVATFYAYSVAADGYTNGASNCLNAIPITSLGIMIDAIYDNGSVNTNEIVIKARNVSGSVIPTGTLWSIMLVAGV